VRARPILEQPDPIFESGRLSRRLQKDGSQHATVHAGFRRGMVACLVRLASRVAIHVESLNGQVGPRMPNPCDLTTWLNDTISRDIWSFWVSAIASRNSRDYETLNINGLARILESQAETKVQLLKHVTTRHQS
jgi:hypothetical protein